MTIAQQLGIKDFPFEIKDKSGNRIYFEKSNNYWAKWEFDSNGNQIYLQNSYNYWTKRKYDSNDNQIYYENSEGIVRDNRSKETITLNGIKYQRVEE